MPEAGDTYTADIALIDGVTGDAVLGSDVANAWVSVNSTEYSISDPQVSINGNNIRLTLTESDTVGLRATIINCKVRLNDGQMTHILTNEKLDFSVTPLTDNT